MPEQRDPTAHPADKTSARWWELQRVVDGALDLPAADRDAYLNRACGTDAALRVEAGRLVDASERAARAGFLAAPAAAFAAPLLADLATGDSAAARERSAVLGDALRAALAGRYAVEREVGRGGMAVVYLARDLRHDRTVAVKVLERNGSRASADRFLREIRIAARLTHPHVLGVHDSGESEGLLWYVMPYVEGETLRARLRRGAVPPTGVVRLLRELADALAYAHARGVVHRDLKPENVLLSDGHAVVADFGIARALAAATAGDAGRDTDEVPLGTPAYMAPEQAASGVVDHRADLYALGVIAYEALTGAHPFAGRSREALLHAHRTEAPAPLAARRPDVPPALAALVMRLLAKEPDARFGSAEAVLRALDRASVAPTSAAVRRRVPAVGVVAVTAIVALGIGGYALGHDAAPPSSPAAAIRTVAVLPFVNVGGAPAGEYFSDGLSDELAHALALVPRLRVAGRTSSRAFRGRAVRAQEVGRALDVGALVDGTVQRAGDRLRVTTQLVSTADGTVLWDSVYESRSGDVFAVQDDFTHAIAAALAARLGLDVRAPRRAFRRGTADQQAYDLYLQGRYYWFRRGPANIARAIACFRQAIARDPAFARAHAGLAMAYGVLPVYLPDPTDSASALAESSADRALALDSTLADAQLALGVASELRLALRDEQAHYRAALALEPSSVVAHHWLGLSLLNLGRTDEALVELRRATEIDPLATSPASALSTALLFARRYPEAAAAARYALTVDSTFVFATWTLGLAQAFGGEADSAVRTLEGGIRRHPGDSRLASALLLAYVAAGRRADAARLRERLARPDAALSDGTEAALAALVFGDREPLVHLLTTERGQRRYVAAGSLLGCNPLLDPLWSDARFHAAMRALDVQACPLAQPWPFRDAR